MPRTPSSLRTFLAELRQRRVMRVAAVYAVAAWVVIQVSDTILPRLGVPEWGVTFVIVLVALGFPVALGLAWAFDITPDGIQRTPDVAAGATPAARPAGRGANVAGVLGVGILIGIIGVGAYVYSSAPDGDGERRDRSIAVLPFVDMSSARDQEYFADGMTEELLNALAGIDSLRVAARTSSFAFKGRSLPIREVAAQLGVRHVLEGSVRKEGDRLRITAQLIAADDGYHLWSDTYDRQLSDVFAIQEEISRAIARALRIELGLSADETVVSGGTASTEAHDLYLRGRFHWNRRTAADLRRAAELLERAVAADPQYAQAWAVLGAAYELLPNYDKSLSQAQYVSRARAALQRALELDPDFGFAHATLGDMLLHYDWDFAASERAHVRALALTPNDATAHSWYAEVLEVTGRLEQALAHRETALRLDPLDPKIIVDYAGILLWLGRTEESLAQLEHALEIDPDFELAHYQRVISGLVAGRLDVAEAEAVRYAALGGDTDTARVRTLFAGIRRTGPRAAALAALAELGTDFTPDMRATYHMALQDPEGALRVLEAGVAARDTEAPWYHGQPAFAPLRRDPRFRALVARIRS